MYVNQNQLYFPFSGPGLSSCKSCCSSRSLNNQQKNSKNNYLYPFRLIRHGRPPRHALKSSRITRSSESWWPRESSLLLFLKGQCHEIFCFWLFSWIIFSPAPEYPIRTVSEIFASQGAPPVSTTPTGVNDTGDKIGAGINDTGCTFCLQFCLCCWYRWQIMGTISGCWDLQVKLKAKMYL